MVKSLKFSISPNFLIWVRFSFLKFNDPVCLDFRVQWPVCLCFRVIRNFSTSTKISKVSKNFNKISEYPNLIEISEIWKFNNNGRVFKCLKTDNDFHILQNWRLILNVKEIDGITKIFVFHETGKVHKLSKIHIINVILKTGRIFQFDQIGNNFRIW